MNTKSHLLKLSVLLLPFFLATGCYHANPADIAAFTKPSQAVVSSSEYKLLPPDEIEIRSSKISEINSQRQKIRPDGKVSFEGIGEVEVAGKTPVEVAEIMKEKFKKIYAITDDEPIDVQIVAYSSQYYYVIGQVERPGPKAYTGRDTVLNALGAATPMVTAWKSKIQVVRPSEDENSEPKIFKINYNEMFVYGDASKNVLLEPGDIVYVPPTILASIGQAVAQLVAPIGQAVNVLFYASRVSGP